MFHVECFLKDFKGIIVSFFSVYPIFGCYHVYSKLWSIRFPTCFRILLYILFFFDHWMRKKPFELPNFLWYQSGLYKLADKSRQRWPETNHNRQWRKMEEPSTPTRHITSMLQNTLDRSSQQCTNRKITTMIGLKRCRISCLPKKRKGLSMGQSRNRRRVAKLHDVDACGSHDKGLIDRRHRERHQIKCKVCKHNKRNLGGSSRKIWEEKHSKSVWTKTFTYNHATWWSICFSLLHQIARNLGWDSNCLSRPLLPM